jgi:hypothetical protein
MRSAFIVSLLILLALPSLVSAETYYVDFDSGDDTDSGTSRLDAWKTIPGTRNMANNNYVCPGGCSGWKRINAGDIIKLRSGTTYDSGDGGRIRINSDYYSIDATPENPISIERDTGWGAGSVIFDGTGIPMSSTGEALISVYDLGGIELDGGSGVSDSYDGIIIRDSERIGFKQYLASTTSQHGCSLFYVSFINNGVDYTSSGSGGSGSGQLYFGGGSGVNRVIDGIRIDYCKFDGGGNAFNGANFGQSDQRVIDCEVSNSIAFNHIGTDPTDEGIGFKAQNSQIKYTSCTSYDNSKGWDSGDEDSNPNWDISYKLVNCEAYGNNMGAGFSGCECSRNGEVKFIIVNSIFRDNSGVGVKSYAGPYKLYIAHSVFDNNDHNTLTHPDGIDDTYDIDVNIFNSIYYKPGDGDGTLCTAYWKDTGLNFNLYSDYNSYIQAGSEYFSTFGAYGGGSTPHRFSYGSNGPGHSSGTWYNFQGWNNDPNSKGTGSDDPTPPPFTDVVNHDYTLTTSYSGMDISNQDWYIPEMGIDMVGSVRTNWDIGAYEFEGSVPPPSCNDGSCNGNENALSCPVDCPAVCEDLFCTHSESCASCPQDCRDCPEPSESLANNNTMVSDSGNFRSDHAVEHLWDGCLEGIPDCTSGAGDIDFFWIEFDFGHDYNLTEARLFGDTSGYWISRDWQFEYKLNSGDSWTIAFSGADAYMDEWSIQDLSGIRARYARVTVNSDTGSTQARELEILGSPICHRADTIIQDCCIDIDEIVLFIGDWKQGLGGITMTELMQGIGLNNSGQGCI